jgi:hypothetical protein
MSQIDISKLRVSTAEVTDATVMAPGGGGR